MYICSERFSLVVATSFATFIGAKTCPTGRSFVPPGGPPTDPPLHPPSNKYTGPLCCRVRTTAIKHPGGQRQYDHA